MRRWTWLRGPVVEVRMPNLSMQHMGGVEASCRGGAVGQKPETTKVQGRCGGQSGDIEVGGLRL